MKIPKPLGHLPTLLIFFLSLTYISCNSSVDLQNQTFNKVSKISNSQEVHSTIPDSIVKFLVSAASKDVHNANLQMPIKFKDVKLGYITTPNKEEYFILSGQYLSQERNKIKEWVSFASIKTSRVEQWNGAIAMSFYNDSQVILDRGRSHSISIEKRNMEAKVERIILKIYSFIEI